MKKIGILFAVFICTGCSFLSDLKGSVFSDVWDEYATEFRWGRSASISQEELKNQFAVWAQDFEMKRDSFVRVDEEGKLQGNMVISGENLSQNIKEYKTALVRLQSVTAKQNDLKKLTRQVCEKQKSSVSCGL